MGHGGVRCTVVKRPDQGIQYLGDSHTKSAENSIERVGLLREPMLLDLPE
jgi:hypothetical protein